MQFASPDKQQVNNVGNSREVRGLLKELDEGIHDKVSLLKILVLKCNDADSLYKKMKQALSKSDVSVVVQLLSQVD